MSQRCPYYIPSLNDVLERLRSCCGFVISQHTKCNIDMLTTILTIGRIFTKIFTIMLVPPQLFTGQLRRAPIMYNGLYNFTDTTIWNHIVPDGVPEGSFYHRDRSNLFCKICWTIFLIWPPMIICSCTIIISRDVMKLALSCPTDWIYCTACAIWNTPLGRVKLATWWSCLYYCKASLVGPTRHLLASTTRHVKNGRVFSWFIRNASW